MMKVESMKIDNPKSGSLGSTLMQLAVGRRMSMAMVE